MNYYDGATDTLKARKRKMRRRVVLFPTNRIHLLVDLRGKTSAENLKKPKQSVFLGSHFGELVAVWLARTIRSL